MRRCGWADLPAIFKVFFGLWWCGVFAGVFEESAL